MSQMMRNKDMRWTKIWALLLVCVIQADAKLKWRFFKVNKFRGFYFRESFFKKFFKSRKSRKLSLANIRDNREHHLARQYNFARISVHKDEYIISFFLLKTACIQFKLSNHHTMSFHCTSGFLFWALCNQTAPIGKHNLNTSVFLVDYLSCRHCPW